MTAKGVWHSVVCPECGVAFEVPDRKVRAGGGKYCSRSCSIAFNGRRHGHTGHNSQSRTYVSWAAMKGRCLNPENPKFYLYGGAGIKVCDRWMDFAAFLADMGERPKGMSLDRIDGTGDYEPGNCQWATPRRQSCNTSQNVWHEVGGQTMTVAQLARHVGVSASTMSWRTKNWPKSRWLEPRTA